jgi:hypothetical protein
MKPYVHAKSSAARYGGVPEDYLDIHDYMDSSKAAMADVRHRAVFHSAFGIFIVERVFGTTRTNSIGKVYSVRDIAEQHVQEDLGFIPSLEHWFKNTPIEDWMMGRNKGVASTKKFIPMDTGPEIPELASPIAPEDIYIDGQFNVFKSKGTYYD